jgi:G:T-mismatch repair DNA endonuclease (very short patch repair protein)
VGNGFYGKTQKELEEWLNSFGFNFKSDHKLLKNGKQIDMYDPIKKLAIEYCGLHWHHECSKEPLAHRVLTALPVEELDRDLKESKRILEELTGKPVLHVAYPGTAHNATVREHAAKAGYITGTIMDPRAATEKDDLMKLPRIMMIDSTDLKKVLP